MSGRFANAKYILYGLRIVVAAPLPIGWVCVLSMNSTSPAFCQKCRSYFYYHHYYYYQTTNTGDNNNNRIAYIPIWWSLMSTVGHNSWICAISGQLEWHCWNGIIGICIRCACSVIAIIATATELRREYAKERFAASLRMYRITTGGGWTDGWKARRPRWTQLMAHRHHRQNI